jgi:hypothetical protein
MNRLRLFVLVSIILVHCGLLQAQRVVYVSSYEGGYCTEDSDHPDEDIRLMNDVFGPEAEGGWERMLFSEIEAAEDFLESTCLLYIDGYCDEEQFETFYFNYIDEINDFVYNGGRLFCNVSNGTYGYFGFDSISKIDSFYNHPHGATDYIPSHPVFNGPYFPASGWFIVRTAGTTLGGPKLYCSEVDTLLIGKYLYEDVDNIHIPMVEKRKGEGKAIFATFHIWHWDELIEIYRNLRRNTLVYLADCTRGANDIGPYHIFSPQPYCNMGSAEPIHFGVYSYGVDTTGTFTACYRVDGGEEVCQEFAVSLAPAGYDSLVFDVPADFSACGNHIVEIWTTLEEDFGADNDTLVTEIENWCAPISTIGLPDTVCIDAGILTADPELGYGFWSGTGITDSLQGTFDPALVGEGNATVVTYTYTMPRDYNMYTIPFEMPELLYPDTITLDFVDGDIEAFPLPFSLPYFNQMIDTLYISIDGYISVKEPMFWGEGLGPDSSLIVICGANLNPGGFGDIIVTVQGEAPNRQFIIHYSQVNIMWTLKSVNVAAIIHEATGMIDYQVKNLPKEETVFQYISNQDLSVKHCPRELFAIFPWSTFSSWDDSVKNMAFRFEPILCSRTITDTIFVTGNVSVPVLGNDTTFCPGGELTIGTDYPGTDLLWNTGDTTTHITITEEGTYTLQLHYGPGGCWLYDTITVTAVEQDVYDDVLGPDTLLCYGDSITIELPEGYLSYTWGSATSDSTLVITDAQNISVELEYASGCSLYDSVHISYREPIAVDFEVTPSPDSGPGGNIIVLPSNGTPPYTIIWNDAFLSGDTIIGTWPATYVLTVTDVNGCSVMDTVVVPIGTTIEQLEENIAVYPNPFTDQLVVQSNAVIEQITVFTLSGQPVWQSLTHTTEQFISSAQWPAGIYLIEIRTEQDNHHVWVERMPR